MTDRKIIVEIITGSNLYGTNRPDSDMDFTGVFLPSMRDLMGLQNPPGEFTANKKISTGPRNESGDVDVKFYNIKNFLRMSAEGQPGCLEMLFAPKSHTTQSSREWSEIIANRKILLSQKGVSPFVGFALSQANKATVKGNNLNAVRAISAWGMTLGNSELSKPLGEYLIPTAPGKCSIRGIAGAGYFDLKPNDHNFVTFTVAGRQYDPGTKTATFLSAIEKLVARYGTRAAAAAEKGYDFKSLMHAYRLLDEAEEFVITGEITLPRPKAQADRLKKIRAGIAEGSDFDWFDDIMDRIDELRDYFLPKTSLPKEVKWDKVNELCEHILWEHLREKPSFKSRVIALFR